MPPWGAVPTPWRVNGFRNVHPPGAVLHPPPRDSHSREDRHVQACLALLGRVHLKGRAQIEKDSMDCAPPTTTSHVAERVRERDPCRPGGKRRRKRRKEGSAGHG